MREKATVGGNMDVIWFKRLTFLQTVLLTVTYGNTLVDHYLPLKHSAGNILQEANFPLQCWAKYWRIRQSFISGTNFPMPIFKNNSKIWLITHCWKICH